MNFLPSFQSLLNRLELFGDGPNRRLTGTYDEFLGAIRAIVATVEVDEVWYLQRYDDVARAVAAGKSRSARQHFVNNGYFEGRLPFALVVDERWYLTEYPDVAEDVRRGHIGSGQAHFEKNGYREGRLPFKL